MSRWLSDRRSVFGSERDLDDRVTPAGSDMALSVALRLRDRRHEESARSEDEV